MHDFYVASGWFSPEQERARLTIVNALKERELRYYSPKDHMLYKPSEHLPIEVFNRNLKEIYRSTAVIASTEGKDMGTLFECGYAYAEGVPIIYYYTKPEKFNIMLASSARAVITTPKLLSTYLDLAVCINDLPSLMYNGDVE